MGGGGSGRGRLFDFLFSLPCLKYTSEHQEKDGEVSQLKQLKELRSFGGIGTKPTEGESEALAIVQEWRSGSALMKCCCRGTVTGDIRMRLRALLRQGAQQNP